MVITGLTRNQFASNRTRVRIPPSPPKRLNFEPLIFFFVPTTPIKMPMLSALLELCDALWRKRCCFTTPLIFAPNRLKIPEQSALPSVVNRRERLCDAVPYSCNKIGRVFTQFFLPSSCLLPRLHCRLCWHTAFCFSHLCVRKCRLW